MYKIEKNVEMPTAHRTKKIYPFEDMKIKDSFFIPLHGREIASVRTSILAVALRHKPMKFTTRAIRNENGTHTGIRCWRVK